MAASVDMKINILKNSIRTFSGWLDSCYQLINQLPQELGKSDSAHLRELAMKYKDLLLQMKERCAYMQEVNELCKEVEKATQPQLMDSPLDTTLSQNTTLPQGTTLPQDTSLPQDTTLSQDTQDNILPQDATIPQDTTHSLQAIVAKSSTDDLNKELVNGTQNQPACPSQLNPKLAELATDVKDLNVRFAAMCLQAKQHYSSLSRVLTASIDRRLSLRSLSSNSSHSGMSSQNKKSEQDRNSLPRQVRLCRSNSPQLQKRKNKRTDKHSKTKQKSKYTKVSLSIVPSSGPNAKESLAANKARFMPSKSSLSKRKLDVITSRDSVFSTDSPSPQSGGGLTRSVSLSMSTDSDRELDSLTRQKVFLRSKSVGTEEYSDTQPRSRRRPKSAVIIQANPDGETALLSEFELSNGDTTVKKRRRSMEINLSSLAGSGLISHGNIVENSVSSSPAVGKFPNWNHQNWVESFSTSEPGDRSSVISIESLDPRAMLTGQMHQNYHLFNANSNTDISVSSTTKIPDLIWEPEGGRIAKWNGNLAVENRLKGSKRSISMNELENERDKAVSLSSRLTEISLQLEEFVHKIAEGRKCALQSLELELHLGQIKAMSSLLEFQDFELTQYCASFSPMARDKLEAKKKSKRFSITSVHSYPETETKKSRDEILKLIDRVGLLKNHCDDAIIQTEEVLEFVVQYEAEIKRFKDSLIKHTATVEAIKKEGTVGYSEENWMKLSDAFTSMTEQKKQLQTICELSNHLLYLEPIFNGISIREELTQLRGRFQDLVLVLFFQLEQQAKAWTDQLLLEMSTIGSWMTETELAVQALAKRSKKPNGMTSKLAETKANLLKEVEKKKADLESISDKLEPICLVLKPEENKSLSELIRQLEKNSRNLEAIEASLQGITANSKGQGNQDKILLRSLYGGKKQDKVQDKRIVEDVKPIQDSTIFQDTSEDNNPYAEIDGLRREIFQSRGQSPPVSSVKARPISISDQVFNISGLKSLGTTPFKPSVLYERMEEVVPSPFLDYDMVPTRPLDMAIEQLPHKISPSHTALLTASPSHYDVPPSARLAPTKFRYTEIDVSLYDNPRLRSYSETNDGEGGNEEVGVVKEDTKKLKKKKALPHEEILIHVGKEWKDLKIDFSSIADHQDLSEVIGSISDHEKQSTCKGFVLTLHDLENQLKGITEQISVLKPPEVPDLERVHASIDQCQKLRKRLENLHPQVEKCNEQSLEVTSILHDTEPNSKVLHLIGVFVFDVSILWHMTNMKVAICMKELRDSESSVNSLHRQLSTLSRMLAEARSLLEDKKNVLDLEDYFKKCEMMRSKLIKKADKRTRISSEIKESILNDPQSKVCQELLDQLNEVETQWLNIAKELSAIPSIEPLLIKRMLSNASQEKVDVEACLQTIKEERGLEVEKVKENCKTCQTCLMKARRLTFSLTNAEKKLHSLASLSETSDGNSSAPSDHDLVELSGVRATTVGRQPKQYIQRDDSIDYEKMIQTCSSLKESSKKIQQEFDDLFSQLVNELKLVTKFHKEYEELNVWLTDTRDILEVTDAPLNPGGMEPPSNPAQLRGKHQAICQQVVTHQPKMEMLHSLASELIQIPVKQSEKELLEHKISNLSLDWDELCQQCVPAGVLPLLTTPTGVGGSLKLQPPGEFEDITQMIEWLILIESKLQPSVLTIGDFPHLKKTLREHSGIEKELKLREKDYKRFMNGIESSDHCDFQDPEPEPEISSNASVVAGLVSVEFSPSKSVKFHDENTLERNRRQIDIQNQKFADSGESSLESSGLEPNNSGMLNSIPYHSVGPIGQRDKLNEEPNLNSPISQSKILNRITSDPECSMSHMIDGMTSQLSEEHYHLTLLWKGIWTNLLQEKTRLEATQERWKNFESKKEQFSRFLFKAEERMAFFFRIIGGTRNFGVIQTEMVAQRAFDGDIRINEQHLSTLNNLSQELITQYHGNDDTNDLKDTMADLNTRWKKMLESYSQHQPTVSELITRWGEFYREYLSFEQSFHSLDMEMSNMNPFVGDMESVKMQLEKLKLVQNELKLREGALEKIRLLALKLVQGVGGNYINADGMNAKLDNVTRRWDHLQSLAVERKSALESALTEKQDFLSHLADCLAWLNQAEKHLRTQKQLGSNLKAVITQQETHQAFWKEVEDQKLKMESIIISGQKMTMERHWPEGTAESLRSEYSGMESRWKWVLSEAEDWGRQLELVIPEMEKFQGLCTDCGKKLTDAEMTMDKFVPLARKIHVLKRQLESLQIFDQTIVTIGESLGVLENSQKRQLELGAKRSTDLFQLVKSYHQRWNSLRGRIEKRHKDIDTAMVKYDPANLGVSALPRGWTRRVNENQVPFYVNTSSSKPQWSHPDLLPLYIQARGDHTLPSYPSSAYPIALRLRPIQKRTQLTLLETRQIMEAYEDHLHSYHHTPLSSHTLSPYDTTVLAIDVFQKVEDKIGSDNSLSSHQEAGMTTTSKFFLNSAVELTSCWIRDVFDQGHEGNVKCSSFMLAILALSSGRLEEKYKALFKVISGEQNSIDVNQLVEFLEQIVQIPQLVCEDQYCSLHILDICAKECFKKFVGVGRLHLPQFIAWLQTEPLPLSWLPVLHRLAASETSIHEVKCGVCKTQPIRGFRYRCIQCSNLDMCQMCYWYGKSAKGHDKSKHYMEEYCLATKSSDEMRDFFKSLQRSFRRKKKDIAISNQKVRKESLAPTQVGGTGLNAGAAHVEPWRKTWSSHRMAPVLTKANSLRGEEHHPGRRFTVTEDMNSAWMRGGGTGANGYNGHQEAEYRIERLKSSSSSPTIIEAGHGLQHVKPRVSNEDMETSINKLSETTKKLSHHLKHMKQRQLSFETDGPSDLIGAESREDILLKRNTSLQGRVKVLQQHNSRLENCISQLKLISEMRQQSSGQSHAASPFHAWPLPNDPYSSHHQTNHTPHQKNLSPHVPYQGNHVPHSQQLSQINHTPLTHQSNHSPRLGRRVPNQAGHTPHQATPTHPAHQQSNTPSNVSHTSHQQSHTPNLKPEGISHSPPSPTNSRHSSRSTEQPIGGGANRGQSPRQEEIFLPPSLRGAGNSGIPPPHILQNKRVERTLL